MEDKSRRKCGMRSAECGISRSIRLSTAAVVVFLVADSAMAADEPTMRGGFGKMIYGLTLELPMTVVEATMTNPPVVGTAVGLLAGVTRAVQTTFAGMVEVSQAFDPWGTKR